MKLLVAIMLVCLAGCAQVAPQVIQIDTDFHQNVLNVANTRIQYVSCDIGLIDGLGIAVSADFPIMDADGARAILQNPAISIALGEMKELAQNTMDENGKPYWKDGDYTKCKILGLGYRTVALSTIDILKLFPQLAPYLTIFAK